MDVAREISKYNDQTSMIEKMKAELADQKAKTYAYAEYLFRALDEDDMFMQEEQNDDDYLFYYHCDVCACAVAMEDLVFCCGINCGKDIDPEVGRKLKLCDECSGEYLNRSPIFTEGDGYFEDDIDGEGPDYRMCSDCHSGETKIPRIHRLTDAYYKLKQNDGILADLPASTIKIGESDIEQEIAHREAMAKRTRESLGM
jgi:hypothetical protein